MSVSPERHRLLIRKGKGNRRGGGGGGGGVLSAHRCLTLKHALPACVRVSFFITLTEWCILPCSRLSRCCALPELPWQRACRSRQPRPQWPCLAQPWPRIISNSTAPEQAAPAARMKEFSIYRWNPDVGGEPVFHKYAVDLNK